MISANGITFRVGKKALFEDVNIQFTEGNCYGLIGANGTGKSTFLKILSGRMDVVNGDEQCASLLCKNAELLSDDCFRLCIDSGERFVQQEQLSFLGNTTRYKNTLALAAGKL